MHDRLLGATLFAVVWTAACSTHVDAFTQAIRGAEEVRLHEGLPHQTFEAAQLEEERRTKKFHELHGHAFYDALPAVGSGDAVALTAVMADPKTYKAFSGEKKCGGFHPDFALEWNRAGGRRYEALVCFGCEEVTIHGPGIEGRYDLDRTSFTKLEELLRKHHQNRPPR